MATQRSQRVGELLREEISQIIQRLNDPRIGMASVTEVQVSPGLREATVYVSVYGSPEQEAESLRVLTGAVGHIRGELGRTLRMRRIPELDFRIDPSLKRGARILELLDGVRAQTKPEPEADSSGQAD